MNHVQKYISHAPFPVILLILTLFGMSSAQAQRVDRFQKINAVQGGFSGTPASFGRVAANIGDLDGDGNTDVAVSDASDGGLIWVLFLKADGTVKAQQRLRNGQASAWGASIALIGDLDADEAPEIAVGAPGSCEGIGGEVWIVSLRADGTAKKRVKIEGADLEGSCIGVSVAGVGDLDGDGVADLAVGAVGPDNRGTVFSLQLTENGGVKSFASFSLDENPTGGETGFQQFGWSMASIGDLNNDGVQDLTIGMPLDDDGGTSFTNRGAVIVAFLNPDGSLNSFQKISATEGNFTGDIEDFDRFGTSIAHLGDFGEANVGYIAVGSVGGDLVPTNTVWILRLLNDGTVSSHMKIDENSDALKSMIGGDLFGESVASLGDLDGDGVVDLMVGASGDNEGGQNTGAVWMLFLDVFRVGAFTLIDAATDQPIAEFDPFQSGSMLDLDTLPIHLNVRAHAAGDVESVRFAFKGMDNFRTESVAPYALFGDTDGDFANGAFQPGAYTLVATPFAEDFGQGDAGMNRTIHFTVNAEVPEGLVLWNTLGTDEEVLHSKIGPDLAFYTGSGGLEAVGDAGYLNGVYDQGVTLAGEYSTFQRVHNVVLNNADQFIDPERGAVEVWYKQDVNPVANLHNIWRVFGGGFGLGSGIAFQSFDGDFDDRQRFILQLSFGGQQAQVYSLETGFDGYNISPYNGQWIHLAGVWDREGIDGGDDTMQLYLNGELVAASSENNWGTTVGSQVDICGANDNSAGLFAMDNLKLWNYAKTDFSDRFVERLSDGIQGVTFSVATASAGDRRMEAPGSAHLQRNYPNPFNPTTTIHFTLLETASVKLTVYDMLGRHVKTLVDGVRGAGAHQVAFEAGDLPSGSYLYRLETPQGHLTRQMLLVK